MRIGLKRSREKRERQKSKITPAPWLEFIEI